MEKELRLNVHFNGKWTTISEAEELGYEYESGATTIVAELPTNAYGARHFLEFIKPSGGTVSTSELTEVTEASGIHSISFKPGSDFLDESGRYMIQYVGRLGLQSPTTFKSALKALDVLRSVNAGVAINESDPDFITWATAEIASLKVKVAALDIAVPNLETRLTALEELIGQTIYMGVIFYGSETVGERLGAAQGLKAGVNGAQNDFDTQPIYKDIKTYLNSAGEKIWECGKSFFYRHVINGVPGDDDFYEAHYISLAKQDENWGLHIAFLDKNKADRGKFTLGAYKACANSDNTKLLTLSGATPKTYITLPVARTMAAANNAHIAELRKGDAVNILMMIEFAVRDFQRELFQGVCLATDLCGSDYASLQLAGAVNKVRYPKSDILSWTIIGGDASKIPQLYAVGTKILIKDDNEGTTLSECQITAFQYITIKNESNEDVECVEVTYSGTGIAWDGTSEFYPALVCMSDKTGQTDNLSGSSHEDTSVLAGVRHFAWRGLEDWYGVYYEWVDGQALKVHRSNTAASRSTKFVVCFDPQYYSESDYNDTVGSPFTHFEEVATLTGNTGFIKSFKHLPSYPGILILDVCGGSNSTFYADSSGIGQINAGGTDLDISCILFCGSSYYSGFNAGPFYSDRSDSTVFYLDCGFRLSYDPS